MANANTERAGRRIAELRLRAQSGLSSDVGNVSTTRKLEMSLEILLWRIDALS